ncbi:uncharacterized protein LOC133460950 [Cololabis saira]|uniref:uncharacterized protein LOC133460950 n=1 Tax=Cololabis saira TaxID=129043 RepID=UPI002AD31508|nr:uncharacterized protein LOC133460950 [Cololabis saira]
MILGVSGVKKEAPAEVQITAEQLLREAKERELELLPPKQEITDKEELNDSKLRKRKRMDAGGSGTGPGGWKQRFINDLWTYFKYNQAERKTECIVEGDSNKCGHKLRGKNTTNLKRHLKTRHTDIFSKILETRTPKEKPGVPKSDRAQSSILAAFAAQSKHKPDSLEQRAKEQAIALWIGRTGLPACTVEDEDFILMMETFDKRLTIP